MTSEDRHRRARLLQHRLRGLHGMVDEGAWLHVTQMLVEAEPRLLQGECLDDPDSWVEMAENMLKGSRGVARR